MNIQQIDNMLFEPISENEASKLVGGQLRVALMELGPIPLPEREENVLLVAPNPTAIQIDNNTGLDLSYGVVYDTFEGRTIEAGGSQVVFGNQPRGAAGWDYNLARSGIQLELALLKPGYQYAFVQV